MMLILYSLTVCIVLDISNEGTCTSLVGLTNGVIGSKILSTHVHWYKIWRFFDEIVGFTKTILQSAACVSSICTKCVCGGGGWVCTSESDLSPKLNVWTILKNDMFVFVVKIYRYPKVNSI